MNIKKKILQVTALFTAAGVQAQNPNIQAIYTAYPAHSINYKLKMNTASKSNLQLIYYCSQNKLHYNSPQPVLTWRSADDKATTFRSPVAYAIDYVAVL